MAACGQGQWKVGRQAHRSHGRASAPGGKGGEEKGRGGGRGGGDGERGVAGRRVREWK